VPAVVSDLWKFALRSSMEMLGPHSSLLSVTSMLRTIAVLRRCGMLSIVFSEDCQMVLSAYGTRFLESLASRLKPNSDGNLIALSSYEVEVGSILLHLAVDCGVAIGSDNAASSLVGIALGGEGGSAFLSNFGSSLVEIIIEGRDNEHLIKYGIEVIDMLNVIIARRIWTSENEKHNYSILVRRMLTGVVERVSLLSERSLKTFVLKISDCAVAEGSVMRLSGGHSDGIICNYDNVMLILYIEAYIFRRYSIQLESAVSKYVLDIIVGVLMSAGDERAVPDTNSILKGGKCDMIVSALGTLPYFLVGTVASCPRPYARCGGVNDKKPGEKCAMTTKVVKRYIYFGF
jgi:hypothetical protein